MVTKYHMLHLGILVFFKHFLSPYFLVLRTLKMQSSEARKAFYHKKFGKKPKRFSRNSAQLKLLNCRITGGKMMMSCPFALFRGEQAGGPVLYTVGL